MSKIPEGASVYSLYGGEVELMFNPKASKYRYTVTDEANQMIDTAVRGVTSILRDIINKPELMMWPLNMAVDYLNDWFSKRSGVLEEQEWNLVIEGAKSAHRKRSDAGRDIGTIVHGAVEHYLRGDSQPISRSLETFYGPDVGEVPKDVLEAVRKAYKTFVRWWESLDSPKVLDVERAVYSREYGYAGTFDFLVDIGGKLYLLDLKTTNASRTAPMGIYSEYFVQLGGYAQALDEEEELEIEDLGVVSVRKDGGFSVVTAGDIGIPIDSCKNAFVGAVKMHDWLEYVSRSLSDKKIKSHLIPDVDGDEDNEQGG